MEGQRVVAFLVLIVWIAILKRLARAYLNAILSSVIPALELISWASRLGRSDSYRVPVCIAVTVQVVVIVIYDADAA